MRQCTSDTLTRPVLGTPTQNRTELGGVWLDEDANSEDESERVAREWRLQRSRHRRSMTFHYDNNAAISPGWVKTQKSTNPPRDGMSEYFTMADRALAGSQEPQATDKLSKTTQPTQGSPSLPGVQEDRNHAACHEPQVTGNSSRQVG